MSDKLPKGWVKTTLGEVIQPSRARALPSEAPELPYVGMEHVEAQTMMLLERGSTSGLKSSSVRFKKGDVLYGKMRPYLNKVWLAEFDGLCSAEFLVFPKTDGLDAQLFAYRLNSQEFVNFANHQVSGDRPRVDFEKLASFPHLLPPADEQKRIAAQLDALLSRVAAGEAAARRALERLKHYRAAVLHAAVTGELTSDWRKTHKPDETGAQLLKRLLAERRASWEEAELKRLQAIGKPPKDDKWRKRYNEPVEPQTAEIISLPKGWAWASVEQISSGEPHALSIGPFGSNLKVSDYRDSGVPLIFVRNIRSGSFSGAKTRFVTTRKAAELAAHQITGGDVLITKMGDPPGEACLYPEAAPLAIITADCIRLHVGALLEESKMYFVHGINSGVGHRQIRRITSGVAQQKVSLSRFSGIGLPLPPLTEQFEIVRQVDSRLAASAQLAANINLQLDRARATRQSLLHDAFAGKLVRQDSKDEPASALLERIRLARETLVNRPKSKRMPKFKTKPTRRPLIDVLKEYKTPITPEQLFSMAGFQPAEADSFYRELATLRKLLRETKPSGVDANAWPLRAKVLLQLKEA